MYNVSEHIMHNLNHLVSADQKVLCWYCDLTGCGQCCACQTGPGEEGGITSGGNKLPQEAA